MTAQQPLNNIVRVTIEALAAILGGAQSLSANAMDEVLSIPSREAAHVALMTQHILANETGIADVVDPMGGSYYVESLTGRIETEARQLMAEIDRRGGAQKAIEEGFYQKLIRTAAGEYQKDIESGDRVIVGLNRFQEDNQKIRIESFRAEEGVRERAIERLRRLKSGRNQDTVQSRLRSLEKAARRGDNTVPALIDCVRAFATVGEMCRVLGSVWGIHQESATWL
jgi:methylmalonyl-CoA mutase N-terminal domain/subunit